MKNTKIKILMIMLFAASLSSIIFVHAAEAPSKFTPTIRSFLLNQNPDPARAGDIVEVRLRFQNNGDAEAKNLQVEFMPEYPFSLLEGKEKIHVIEALPNWPVEENTKTLVFKLRVDRNAVEGRHPVTFRHTTDDGSSWAVKEYSIELTSKEFAEIIYIDKTKLMPGQETEMTFNVNNIGNAPLQNVVFSWDEPNNVVLPVGSDNTRYIKYLGPNENLAMKYTVVASVNANPDLYQLNLNLEFDVKGEDGETKKENISTKAGIFVGGETDFDITFSENTQGKTSLSVANVGSNPALSVTVRVPEQEGFRVSGSSDAIVGNLDKGDYTIVSFQINQAGGRGGAEGVSDELRKKIQSGELSREERQKLREQIVGQRDNKLKVVIDYTDTTGKRQTIEKPVSIQFRSFGAEGSFEGQENSVGSGGAGGGNFRGRGGSGGFGRQQESVWSKPGFVIPIILVAITILWFVYHRKKQKAKPILKELLAKVKSIRRKKG